ncbi:heterokaryon incompatibility protein-domain-containing protein [Podospora aff. communis PSN243]|uniref:Heterokaryon incompatibility protein-domain-containing protein n=1 Tax=Podospora aff. communis PSN243 TaxID=3040156 RepID=A0AAV9GBM5_9PEZI|nr:heterokaryon incompatibility protein-domain-containing protein [Podospora aff. communis PSN243]
MTSSEDAAPAYCYEKLLPDEKVFRLIKLRNGEDGTLRTNITTHLIADAPPYVAISYTWESTKLTHSLQFGDTTALAIPEHVLNLLHDLRPDPDDAKPLYLWIDFICINQTDLFEKDHQIPLMREIYASAKEAVVYLGRVPDAASAHAFLPMLRTFWAYTNRLQQSGQHTADLPFNPFTQFPEGLTAFHRLVSHRYWTRTWIIQEIATARKVRIRYGDKYLDWDFLKTAIQIFWNQINNYDQLLASTEVDTSGTMLWTMNRIDNLADVNDGIANNGAFPLPDVILLSSQSNATEPRDKVVGILGLSTSASAPDLQPDHTLSAQQVYINATAHCLRRGSFALLNLAGRLQHENMGSTLGLPSWVPDLSRAPLIWPLDNPQAKYACGGPKSTAKITFSPDQRTLITRGFIVGRILALADPISDIVVRPRSFADLASVAKGKDSQETAEAGARHLESVFNLVGRLVPDPYPPANNATPIITAPDIKSRLSDLLSYLDTSNKALGLPSINPSPTTPSPSPLPYTSHLLQSLHSLPHPPPTINPFRFPPIPTPMDLYSHRPSSTPTAETQLGPTRYSALWRTLLGNELPPSAAGTSGPDIIYPAPETTSHDFDAYLRDCRAILKVPCLRGDSSDKNKADKADDYVRNMRWGSAMGRKALARLVAVTDRGHLGLVHAGTEVGDEVVVVRGARTGYVLRGRGRGDAAGGDGGEGGDGGYGGKGGKGEYELVCEAYLHGFMDGEGLKGGFEERELAIV